MGEQNFRAEGTTAVYADVKLKGSSSDFAFVLIFQKNKSTRLEGSEMSWEWTTPAGGKLGWKALMQYGSNHCT